jgi:hypothetical protein
MPGTHTERKYTTSQTMGEDLFVVETFISKIPKHISNPFCSQEYLYVISLSCHTFIALYKKHI